MNWFHQHVWKEQSRHQTPRYDFAKMRGSERLVERLVMGLTVIVLRCETCGDMKSVEIKGHAGA